MGATAASPELCGTRAAVAPWLCCQKGKSPGRGHGTLQTRPGNMPNKMHFSSLIQARWNNLSQQANRTRHCCPQWFYFGSFFLPNRVQNRTVECTIKKHFQARAERGVNISPTLQKRIKVFRVVSETKPGTAAEPGWPRVNEGLSTKSPFIHVYAHPNSSEIWHLKMRPYLLHRFCLKKSRTSLCPVASACK